MTGLITEAQTLGISCVQFFLVDQKTRHYLTFTDADKQAFIAARHSFLTHAFIHSAYWINPASPKPEILALSRRLLKNELAVANALEVPHIVLHPGSTKGYPVDPQDPDARLRGLQALATTLNKVLKHETNVGILLENIVIGGHGLGGDLEDFLTVKQYLDQPEKVGFCFDTAHAYSYGYTLDLEPIISLIDRTMGLNQLKLIHFNDSANELGSQLDRHAAPGLGKIGKQQLLPLLSDQRLSHIPKIIEVAAGDTAQLSTLISGITTW